VTVIARAHVPITPYVESNSRKGEHWAIKKRRADAIKEATFVNLRRLPIAKQQAVRGAGKLMVRFTMVSSHKPDNDGLSSALKFFQDETARFLGVNDGDEGAVAWTKRWERYEGRDKDLKKGVHIEFIPFADYLVEAKAEIEAQLAALGANS